MRTYIVSYVHSDGVKGSFQIGAADLEQAIRFTHEQLADDAGAGYRLTKVEEA